MALKASIFISLKDGFSAGLTRLNSGLKKVSKTSFGVSSRFSDIASKTSMASMAASQFATTATNAIQKPISAFEDFESEMARVKGLTGATNEEFEKLTSEAMRLGSSVGEFSALDAAKGMAELGMAGRKTEDIIKSLPGALDLSSAAQTSLAETLAITTGVMGAFGLKSDQTNRVSSVLTSAFTNSKTTLQSLGETISFAGRVAKTSSVSLEQVAVMAGLLGDASIDSGRAGTTMRSSLLLMSGAAKGPAVKALRELRIELSTIGKDGKKVPKDIYEIFKALKKSTSKMDPEKQTSLLATIFGREAITGAQILMDEIGGDKFNTLTTSVNSTGRAHKDLAIIMRATAKNVRLELNSALDGLYITLGQKLAPVLSATQKKITSIVVSLTEFAKENPKVARGIMVTTAAVAALATVAAGLLITISAVSTALSIAAAAFGSSASGATLLGVGIKGLAGIITKVAIPAGIKLSAAIWPVTLVAAAIAGVAYAGYLMYTNWDKIGTWFLNLWERFKSASIVAKIGVVGLALAIGVLFSPLLVVIGLIAGVVTVIKKWDQIKQIAKDVWGSVTNEIEAFSKKVSTAFDKVIVLAGKVKDKFSGIMDSEAFGAMKKFASVVSAPTRYVAGKIGEAGSEVVNVLTGETPQAQKWQTLQGQDGSFQKQDIGGKLEVFISSEGKAEIRKMESNGGLDIEAELGSSMSSLPVGM